ncbi:MAG: helix-turn-helix transcriptional regulator [bacterium]|nr:helix-turn-helix transcriptional regulator [bacterium]
MKKESIAKKVVAHVLSRSEKELSSLTVDSVATELKLSRSHLSRVFGHENDFTIEDLIFKVKIVRATILLREDKKLKIKEISKRMGFSRPDYFIRVFKSFFGTTPAKYRELIKTSGKNVLEKIKTSGKKVL